MNQQEKPPVTPTADYSCSLDHTLAASVETRDQPQSRAAFERPGATNGDAISANKGHRPLAIDNVHAKIPTTNGVAILFVPKDSMSSVLSPEGREGPKPEPASALATAPPSTLEGAASEVTTTAEDAPFGVQNAFDKFIIKHRKVVSTVSTVLITVGGIVLLPGLSTCVSGTILAHPGVTLAGGIAVVVGKWLRRALDSATVRDAARAKASGQVA